MLQARALQRRGGGDDPKGAAALYRRIIAMVPNSSQAELRLSESIQETGDIEGALEPAVKATELDPKSGEAWAHLALLRYYLANSSPAALAQATQALRKATRLLPNDAELWTRYAETLEDGPGRAGRPPGLARRGQAPPLPHLPRQGARRVRLRARRGALRQAQAVRGPAGGRPGPGQQAQPDPRHMRILEELARDQVDAGFLGHAEESFAILGQFLPEEPAIWENIAIIQLRTYRSNLALESPRRGRGPAEADPGLLNIGLCLMQPGPAPEAEARWKALLPALASSQGEDAGLQMPVKVLYASCLLMEGRPKEMLALCAPWPELANHS